MQGDEIQIQLGNYLFNQKYCIGQGSFGKVYRGRNLLTNRIVAIKQMDGKMISQNQISMQIGILREMKHANIVEYEDAFQNNGYFYIVTEYCEGGDLRNLMDNSDQQGEGNAQARQHMILQMLKQVIAGFIYLSKFLIIHRDLKPSNILLQGTTYKISDFGLAKRESVHKSVIHQELVGVPIYMSPQILSKNYYTYKCDVWSLGIIVFEMLFEHLPWRAGDVEALFFQIMNAPEPYKEELKERKGRGKEVPKVFVEIMDHTIRYLEKERASWQRLAAICSGEKYQQRGKQKKQKDTQKKQRGKQKKQRGKQKNSFLLSNLELPFSRYHPQIPTHQLQLVNHIYSQGKSLQPQLLQLSSPQSLLTLFSIIRRYLCQGPDLRQMLMDCSLIYLRMLSNKLHLQLMQYQSLEDARPLLIFLQLLHDYVISGHRNQLASLSVVVGGSLRERVVSEYAASVISKVNTLLMYQGVGRGQGQ